MRTLHGVGSDVAENRSEVTHRKGDVERQKREREGRRDKLP